MSKQIIKIFLLKIFSICHQSQRHQWCTFSCEDLGEFSTKFETALKGNSGAWKKLIHEKNLMSKISWHCNFNGNETNAIVYSPRPAPFLPIVSLLPCKRLEFCQWYLRLWIIVLFVISIICNYLKQLYLNYVCIIL